MKNKLIEIVRAMSSGAFTNEEKADYLLQHDVVPVVRCKDCEYMSLWARKDKSGYYPFCHKIICGVKENDFCSYGERKEDGD